MNENYQKAIKILKTAKSIEELKANISLIKDVFPMIELMNGFNQENTYHKYNLYEHSLFTVLYLPRNIDDDMIYIAALFHDIGKLYTKSIINGKTHYYGHEKKSFEVVKERVLPFLIKIGVFFLDDDLKRLEFYILKHDEIVGWPIDIYKFVENYKLKTFSNLMFLQVADSKSHKKTPVSIRKRIVCYTYATFNGMYFYFMFNIYMFLRGIKRVIIC